MKCLHCSGPAIASRLPDSRWHRWIHRLCWPCLRASYKRTEAQLVRSVLYGVRW